MSDSVVATVYLVTGDIEKPDSIALSRSWAISLKAVEAFAEMMTEVHGEPRHAIPASCGARTSASSSSPARQQDPGRAGRWCILSHRLQQRPDQTLFIVRSKADSPARPTRQPKGGASCRFKTS